MLVKGATDDMPYWVAIIDKDTWTPVTPFTNMV